MQVITQRLGTVSGAPRSPAVAFNPPLFTISLPSGGLVPRHGHCSPPSPPWMGGGRAAWRMTHVLSV